MGNNVADLLRQEFKDIVKEALKEVLSENKIFMGGVDLASTPDKAVETTKAVKNTAKTEETSKGGDTASIANSGRRAELDAMKYNELKALVSSLGEKAVGGKDALIALVLKLEGEQADGEDAENENDEADAEGNGEADAETDNGNDEETSSGETGSEAGNSTEEFTQFLTGLSRAELEEIADECNVKYSAKIKDDKLIPLLVVDLTILEKALDVLGYYDDDDSSEDTEAEETQDDAGEDDDHNIVDELGLNDMSIEELADILAEHDLSTKGKKQALIDRIVKGVEDGTIELSDEEEEEAPAETTKEEPKKTESKKADAKEDKKPLKKAETSKYPARDKKEAEVEADIRKQYAGKKLKDTDIAKFVKNYTDGDPKSLSKEEALELYIEVKKSLVDDDGNVTAQEEPYERNGEYHCCGRELKTLDNGSPYCEICGTEYQE